MFIEEIYFSETDEGRYSGFNSKKEKIIPRETKNKNRLTKPEKIFNEITPDIVEYVGNRKWEIRTKKKRRNPDFKIKAQNKVIEIFGIYYHDIFRTKNGDDPDNPKDRIKEYKEIGVKCIVFWEYEILKVNDKRKGYPKPNLERALKKTLGFIRS